MSEMLLVKSAATAAAVGTFALAGMAAERMLRRFETIHIRALAVRLAACAVAALLALLALNPARWPDPAVKIMGDLLAFGAIGCFLGATLLGFAIKARR